MTHDDDIYFCILEFQIKILIYTYDRPIYVYMYVLICVAVRGVNIYNT